MKYLAREKVRFTAFVFSASGKSDNTAQGQEKVVSVLLVPSKVIY